MNFEDEIINLLTIGNYSFIEVAEMYEITVEAVKKIYRKALYLDGK